MFRLRIERRLEGKHSTLYHRAQLIWYFEQAPISQLSHDLRLKASVLIVQIYQLYTSNILQTKLTSPHELAIFKLPSKQSCGVGEF